MLGFPLGILSAAGAAVGFESDYELIETAIVSGTATSSVTFSSLATYASTYKHLQIRHLTRNSTTGNEAIQIRFNGVSSAVYSWHSLYNNQSGGLLTGSAFNATNITSYPGANSDAPANVFMPAVIDILDAFSTTKNKTTRQLAGARFGASAQEVSLYSGCFQSTASTTSLSLTTQGGVFVAGSRFSLYGIRG
jgi:hypothetical protein